LEREIPGITVTGTVEDVKPFLERATVFVAPVRMGEGIKSKVLEALAMGLPVVATRRSLRGLEAVPDRDLLVADTPTQFAAQVLRLLDSPDLRQELSDRGLALVRCRYEWTSLAPELGKIYEEALARAPQKQAKAYVV
jgi:glycosyltransferase involved in cell wall biosynthesis